MDNEYSIEVNNIKKSFKIYYDKGHTLKETSLFKKRRNYEMREVLKGISFKVKKGEAVALIGHNGCGKSTTLKMLTRIMYPDEGTITMRGRVSSLIELGAGFHPDMTGRENIFINASIFGLTHKEIEDRVDQIIEFSELEEFIDNPVRTYSSGMYMRLAFAVAINVDADILLIDEILAVGDANFQAKCYEKLKELKSKGVTIVIVTHVLDTVKDFCEQVIWIDGGNIAAQGSPEETINIYLKHMAKRRLEKEKETASSEDIYISQKGKVKISNYMVFDSKGKPTTLLRADEPFSLVFRYHVNEPVDDLVLSYGLYTTSYECVTKNDSNNQNIKLSGKEDHWVKIASSAMGMPSGHYRLQVSLMDNNGDYYDHHREIMGLLIDNNSLKNGCGKYETNWEIIDGDTPEEDL